jgi:hypothetical protein
VREKNVSGAVYAQIDLLTMQESKNLQFMHLCIYVMHKKSLNDMRAAERREKYLLIQHIFTSTRLHFFMSAYMLQYKKYSSNKIIALSNIVIRIS